MPCIRRSLLFFASVLLLSCSSEKEPDGDGRVLRTERDQWGLITCSPANETTTCYTHRAIMGVSMGAGGAGQLGFKRPDLFDAVGMLGSPTVDWVFMMRNIERSYLGGFCDRETILANLSEVADPNGAAFCGPSPSVERFTPDRKIMEPLMDYNHWYRWIDEGRGGSFGRNKLRESFQDISLSYGNPIIYSDNSPYYPPGLPMDYRSWSDSEKCDQPYVISGLKHKEFNPDGTHDVIAFCDTRTNEGEFDPNRPSEVAMEILLAVDYNQNGIRDYAEPILMMNRERFEDTGTKPNDDYEWHDNPTGTAGNWLYDEGESYEDTGLDGVAGTGDYGEGNGKYDYSPHVMNFLDHNPRTQMEQLEQGHLDRMHIWADAGIRDFLYSAGATNWFWGGLTARVGAKARAYTSTKEMLPGHDTFDFLAVDYSEEAFGRHVYFRYGDPDAEEREIQKGDGHHVGSVNQVLNRFLTSLTFVQNRFLDPDHAEFEGEMDGLIKPETYYSEAMSEDRPFGLVLPPGYHSPENAEQRYPVVYFMHGQGQESDHLLASGILFYGFMGQSAQPERERRRESDWAKFIIIFPDSTCTHDFCSSGNFNSNHLGLDGNGPKYEDALFELFAHVEKTYRTAVPVEVPRE